ncbi:MAG: PilZ domain-containing protein [Candidatus Aminicenantes bacterium]|nr:PilZ domain-containing protein [Candidatus Aminicenantes bacterium]MBL7083634.1 PilZ domain-containing protein [Candidatus Aminicenantes bacterium]
MSEQRRAKRVREEAQVTITLISKDLLPVGKKISYHLTKDISSTGIKIRASAFLPINAVLRIDISFEKPPRVIHAFGKVRWVKSIYADELFEMGIEFVDTSQENIELLKEYIEKAAITIPVV